MNVARRFSYGLIGAAALGASVGGCSDGEAAPSPTATVAPLPDDTFTPLVASVATPAVQAFAGTDGKMHVVYELRLSNTRAQPATLQRVSVVEAGQASRVHAAFEGAALQERVHSLANGPASPTIPLDGARQLLVDLAFDGPAAVPAALTHRFDVQAASIDARVTAPTQQSYTAAPLALDARAPIAIGPPVAGSGWVAFNGCCGPNGVHRGTGLPVNGAIHYAQRFAIDWIRMDAQGFTVRGDPGDVRSYTAYGADLLAVADGIVVDVLDTLEDQVPPTLPDPATINLKNVDGNHVTLDLGQGRYAFYAHMQKGSVTVALGQRVTRGQVLGRLGNSGNTSAPHLHFHVMDGASVLGSSGLPYVIDGFAHAGVVPDALAANDRASWAAARSATPTRRALQFPMNQSIIDF